MPCVLDMALFHQLGKLPFAAFGATVVTTVTYSTSGCLFGCKLRPVGLPPRCVVKLNVVGFSMNIKHFSAALSFNDWSDA